MFDFTCSNMLAIAWFQVRLDKLRAIGDIADADRIIHYIVEVDGYEFGHVVVSKINSTFYRP